VADLPSDLADAVNSFELILRQIFIDEGYSEATLAQCMFDLQTTRATMGLVEKLQSKVDMVIQMIKIQLATKPKATIMETARSILTLNDIYNLQHLTVGDIPGYKELIRITMPGQGPYIPKEVVKANKAMPPLPGENGPYTPHWEGYPTYY